MGARTVENAGDVNPRVNGVTRALSCLDSTGISGARVLRGARIREVDDDEDRQTRSDRPRSNGEHHPAHAPPLDRDRVVFGREFPELPDEIAPVGVERPTELP